MVLPGIVDLHGDAFERQMMPRPGVDFPVDVALVDSDRQAISNGITTVFHATTWSWEPGLRSGDNARQLLEAIEIDAAAACGRHPLPSAPRDLQSRCRNRDRRNGCPTGASTCSRSTTTWIRTVASLAKPQKRSRMVERTGLIERGLRPAGRARGRPRAHEVPASIARLAQAARDGRRPDAVA